MSVDPRFEQLFSRSLDGVFFASLDQPIRWDDSVDKDELLDYAFDHLRIAEVNQPMCEQMQAQRDALIGTTPRARWHGHLEAWRSNTRLLYDRGQCHLTVRAARADGRLFDVEGAYACLYDQEGRLTGHFGIQRDVSERLRMRERLAISERLASIGTLAAGVGHEINNPLTYILTNLSMMERELSALEQLDDLAAVRERIGGLRRKLAEASYGAGRVREIVRDLRSLTGSDHERREAIDLRLVVDRALRLTDYELRQRAVVVREIGPVPAVLASEGRLVQVVVNLLVNAAHAIPAGDPERHQIRIATATTPGGSAQLEVSVSGVAPGGGSLFRVVLPAAPAG